MFLRASLIWVCTVCLGLSQYLSNYGMRKCYGIFVLDRISCAMVWSFVVMNLTISGIIYKKVCYLDLEVIGMSGYDDE